MEYEFKIDDRLAKVEMINRENDHLVVKVDGKKYDLDIIKVGNGIYSILYAGKSYNIELIEGETHKQYIVNTLYKTFNMEVVDAESRYLMNRNSGEMNTTGNNIISPMPGKVVRIMVNEGEEVTSGQTIIVISAMKMESEYKSIINGKIKKIFVSEGDTVAGNQIMVSIEPVE